MTASTARRRVRAAVLGAAATACVLLAGCTGASGAPDRSPSVAATTAPSGSPSPSVVDPESFLDDLAARVDAAHSVVVTLEAPGLSASASMDLAAGAARVLWRDEEGGIYVVVVDGSTYTSDADQVAAPWRQVASTRVPLAGLAPSAHVAGWRAGVREVTRLGSETIEGHELTSYALVIDARRAFAARGAPPPAGSPPTVTYTLRLDESGLPRDASVDLGGDRFGFGHQGWGAPIEGVAPPLG